MTGAPMTRTPPVKPMATTQVAEKARATPPAPLAVPAAGKA